MSPRFTFSSLQLSSAYIATVPVDVNNQEIPVASAVGDYKGGRLWLCDPGGNDPVTAVDKMREWPHHKPGDVIMGRYLDIAKTSVYSSRVLNLICWNGSSACPDSGSFTELCLLGSSAKQVTGDEHLRKPFQIC